VEIGKWKDEIGKWKVGKALDLRYCVILKAPVEVFIC
jgi:hypothetical protein